MRQAAFREERRAIMASGEKFSANRSVEARGKKLGIIGHGPHRHPAWHHRRDDRYEVITYYDIENKFLGNAIQVPNLGSCSTCPDVISLHVPETASTKDPSAQSSCVR